MGFADPGRTEYLDFTPTAGWIRVLVNAIRPQYLTIYLFGLCALMLYTKPNVAYCALTAMVVLAWTLRQPILKAFRPFDLGYRLGDMVARHEQRCFFNGEEYHLRWYPDSIASKYILKTGGNRDNDIDALKDIVATMPHTALDKIVSRPNVLTIHLRLGDIATRNFETVLSINEFVALVDLPPGLTHSVIVTSLDAGKKTKDRMETHTAGRKVIASVQEALSRRSITSQLSLDRTADEDFALLSRSSHLIPSIGNYSRLAASVAKASGANVIFQRRWLRSREELWWYEKANDRQVFDKMFQTRMV